MFDQPSERSARGVSPVVGIVLLVAITVLLAATAATFVLGQDEPVDGARASFGYSYEDGSDDALRITHQSGDRIESRNLVVVVTDASHGATDPNDHYRFHELTGGRLSATSTVGAGQSATLDGNLDGTASGDLDLSGATVRLFYEAPGTGQRFKLGEWGA